MATTGLTNFRGLFGDQEAPFAGLAVHYEPLQSRTQLYDYEISEHLHSDLVQLFLITTGGGLLLSTGKRIKIESPCVVFIPSNTLHGFAFQTEVQGEVFTVSAALFDEWVQRVVSIVGPMEELQYFNFTQALTIFSEVLEWKGKIIRALQTTTDDSQITVPLLFQLLLISLCQANANASLLPTRTGGRMLQHFKAYKALLKQQGHEGRTINDYAQQLGMTSVHLNRICKAVTGQTALRVAHNYLMGEARKYLHGTSYSVAEIAYFLGFKDPAHFSRLFKKINGKTPGQFRRG